MVYLHFVCVCHSPPVTMGATRHTLYYADGRGNIPRMRNSACAELYNIRAQSKLMYMSIVNRICNLALHSPMKYGAAVLFQVGGKINFSHRDQTEKPYII